MPVQVAQAFHLFRHDLEGERVRITLANRLEGELAGLFSHFLSLHLLVQLRHCSVTRFDPSLLPLRRSILVIERCPFDRARVSGVSSHCLLNRLLCDGWAQPLWWRRDGIIEGPGCGAICGCPDSNCLTRCVVNIDDFKGVMKAKN